MMAAMRVTVTGAGSMGGSEVLRGLAGAGSRVPTPPESVELRRVEAALAASRGHSCVWTSTDHALPLVGVTSST
jgi:hypothetical protein